MATYTAVAVTRTPAQSAAPALVELGPLAGTLSYTHSLNEAGEATVSVSVETLQDDIKTRLRDPVSFPLEVWVYRDSDIVFAGPVSGGEIVDDVLNLTLRGLEFYLAYMVRDTDYSATAVDQYTIAKTLVDNYQALDYGNYGIDTSGIGTSGTVRDFSVAGATEPRMLYEVIKELGEVTGGFDWKVDPSTRDLILADPIGSDLSASVFLERGVTSGAVRFSLSPGLIASEVHATGTGPSLTTALHTTKSNTSLRAAFGRCGLAVTFDPVEDATNLGDTAQAFLDARSDIFFIPGPGLIPVTGAGVSDFHVGDTVTYTFDAGLGQVTGSYRIIKKTVEVGDSGQETMTVDFA